MTDRRLTALAVGCAITLVASHAGASGVVPLDEDTVMWVDPASTTVNNGHTFTIHVAITTIPETRGAQCGISFDPSILYCNSLTEGAFYSTWAAERGGSTFFIGGSIDNPSGTVNVAGVAILGGGPGGPTGTDDYLDLNCTAIGTGTSPIGLFSAIVSSASGTSLPLTVYNGSVTVQ